MDNKEIVKKRRIYEMGYITAYLSEMEDKIKALQTNITFVQKFIQDHKNNLEEEDMEMKGQEDKGKYLWKVNPNPVLGHIDGIHSIRCLGIDKFPGEVLFENSWFQRGDIAMNGRIKLILTSGPTKTDQTYNGKMVHAYNYVVGSEDMTQVPIDGEYYGKMTTNGH